MTRWKFGREFKTGAAKLMTEQDVPVVQGRRDLDPDLAGIVLRRWMCEATVAPITAFPGRPMYAEPAAGRTDALQEDGHFKSRLKKPKLVPEWFARNMLAKSGNPTSRFIEGRGA